METSDFFGNWWNSTNLLNPAGGREACGRSCHSLHGFDEVCEFVLFLPVQHDLLGASPELGGRVADLRGVAQPIVVERGRVAAFAEVRGVRGVAVGVVPNKSLPSHGIVMPFVPPDFEPRALCWASAENAPSAVELKFAGGDTQFSPSRVRGGAARIESRGITTLASAGDEVKQPHRTYRVDVKSATRLVDRFPRGLNRFGRPFAPNFPVLSRRGRLLIFDLCVFSVLLMIVCY